MSAGPFGLHGDPGPGRCSSPTFSAHTLFVPSLVPCKEKVLGSCGGARKARGAGTCSQTQNPVVLSLHGAASQGLFSQGHQIPRQKLNPVYLILKSSILCCLLPQKKKMSRKLKCSLLFQVSPPPFRFGFLKGASCLWDGQRGT